MGSSIRRACWMSCAVAAGFGAMVSAPARWTVTAAQAWVMLALGLLRR